MSAGLVRNLAHGIARLIVVASALLCASTPALAEERGVNLDWQMELEVETHDIQVGFDPEFKQLVFASRAGRNLRDYKLKPGEYWIRKKKATEMNWGPASRFDTRPKLEVVAPQPVVAVRAPASLPAPRLVWPAGAVSFRTETLPFSWTHVSGAKNYDVKLYVQSETGPVLIASTESGAPFAKEVGGVLAPGQYEWEVTSNPEATSDKVSSTVRQSFTVKDPSGPQRGTGHLGVSWLVSNYNYSSAFSSRYARFDTFAYGPEVNGEYWLSTRWRLVGKVSDRIFPIGTTLLHDTHMNVGLYRELEHADPRWSFQIGANARLDTVPEVLPSGGADTSISQIQTISWWPGFWASFSQEPQTALVGSISLGRNAWITGRDYRGGATVQYEMMVGARGYWFYPWGLALEVTDSYRQIEYDYQGIETELVINTIEAMVRLTHDF